MDPRQTPLNSKDPHYHSSRKYPPTHLRADVINVWSLSRVATDVIKKNSPSFPEISAGKDILYPLSFPEAQKFSGLPLEVPATFRPKKYRNTGQLNSVCHFKGQFLLKKRRRSIVDSPEV